MFSQQDCYDFLMLNTLVAWCQQVCHVNNSTWDDLTWGQSSPEHHAFSKPGLPSAHLFPQEYAATTQEPIGPPHQREQSFMCCETSPDSACLRMPHSESHEPGWHETALLATSVLDQSPRPGRVDYHHKLSSHRRDVILVQRRNIPDWTRPSNTTGYLCTTRHKNTLMVAVQKMQVVFTTQAWSKQ